MEMASSRDEICLTIMLVHMILQEHADLQAAMVTEDPSSDKRTLQQQLLDQLQQHIKHLQELQKHKQADLTAAE